jgi:hypothetical protein
MADRDGKSPPAPDHDEAPGRPEGGDDSLIPGKHGKHGGGMESEGAPQEEGREGVAPYHNGADHNRH